MVRTNCEDLTKCGFLKMIPLSKEMELAQHGFVRLYCRGGMKERCVRRMVTRSLGDPARVPENMMPNGLPIAGTDDRDWPSDVKILSAMRFRI